MARDAAAATPRTGRGLFAFRRNPQNDPIRNDLGELLRLAGPVVLARLGIMTMGLTDAIVVGRFSAVQLSYHDLGWAPTSVVLTMAVGLLIGVQVMTARYIGEGRRADTGAVLLRGLVYAFWIGMVSALAIFFLGPLFLHALGLEKDLADGATHALRVFAWSLPTYLVSVAATFYLEALSKPQPGMWAMWGANAANLVLNLLLVPGVFGLPAMGAVGAAWATFGARLVLMIWILAYIARMPEARALGVFRKPVNDKADAVAQRKVGYGAGASYFVEAGAFAGMNIVAGWLGELAVAGWAIVLNVAAVIFMAPLGLATATAVLVGRAYGARDRGGVVRGGVLGFGVAAVVGLVVALIVWPTAPLIARVYTTDPAVIAMTAAALVLCCLFFVADGVQVVVAQALRARGDIWVPTATHVLSYAVVMGPLGWWLAHPMGMSLDGIVWGVIVASLMSAGLLLGRFAMLARSL